MTPQRSTNLKIRRWIREICWFKLNIISYSF